MAYVEPVDRATGLVVTAPIWNQDVAENQRSLFPDAAAGAAWSPTLEATNTDATTVVTGRQYRIGAIQFLWARFVIDINGPLNPQGSGIYVVEFPTTPAGITTSTVSGQVIGSAWLSDASSTGNRKDAVVVAGSSTHMRFMLVTSSSEYRVSSTHPFTWAADDVLTFHAQYPVA
jgi:hypothetical protein